MYSDILKQHLKEEIRNLRAKADVLEALLGEEKQLDSDESENILTEPSVNFEVDNFEFDKHFKIGNRKKNGSMSTVIRSLLTKRPQSVKELTEQVVELGYPFGRVKPNVRVGSELSRLKKLGLLKQTDDKRWTK